MTSGGCSSDAGICANECKNAPNRLLCTMVCLDRLEAEANRHIEQIRCNNLRNYADLLVNTTPTPNVANFDMTPSNGHENLVALIRYAKATYNYSDARQLADDISCALTGARGSNTIVQAHGIYGKPKAKALGKYGWHSDYDDTTDNQAFHFWAYVNTTAQGGGILGGVGDYIHECWDVFDKERSWEDTRLAIAGIMLGASIRDGLPTDQVDDWVDSWLTSSFAELLQSQGLVYENLMNLSLGIRICPMINVR